MLDFSLTLVDTVISSSVLAFMVFLFSPEIVLPHDNLAVCLFDLLIYISLIPKVLCVAAVL